MTKSSKNPSRAHLLGRQSYNQIGVKEKELDVKQEMSIKIAKSVLTF